MAGDEVLQINAWLVGIHISVRNATMSKQPKWDLIESYRKKIGDLKVQKKKSREDASCHVFPPSEGG